MRAPLLLGLLVLSGCSGPAPAPSDAGRDAARPDAGPTAPIFRTGVVMADRDLATEALRLMGATEAGGTGRSCHACHGLTRQSVAHMRELSDAAWSSCFADLTPSTPAEAQEIVDCFREGSIFTASHLGIYASGGYNPWFSFVFQLAYGEGWEDEHRAFLQRAAMPPVGETPFTQAEFNLVTEWFLRGAPFADEILPGVDPGACTTMVTGSVAAIVEDSARSGWSARNAASGMLLHGCAGAATARDCLGDYPLAADRPEGAGWSVVPGSQARILFEAPYRSSFWTRSSADGRFVAHGGGTGSGASVIDLLRGLAVPANASYDPGFFPDNSGIVFQGGSLGTVVCEQSVLAGATALSFTEPGCTSDIDIALYQHMGSSLEGGDHWAVNSSWSGDNGGNGADPSLFVDPSSTVTFISMRNTGSGFTPGDRTSITLANEGSAILAPSARMMVTQIATAEGRPLGYVLRRLDIGRDAGGARTIAAPEIARYCYPGGKPAISLDDRWLVTHHRATDDDAEDLGFTGPSDPAFAPYRGVSNLYLVDLTTGARTRLTFMAPDQQALFPHFRSDGWIYFQVRTDGPGPEYTVATDAALLLAGG
jgi:hypothetical protein